MAEAVHGVTLEEPQASILMAHIAALAERLEGEPPHHVTVTLGVDIGVSFGRKWIGADQAQLSIGVASLYALSGRSLAAVLAHEMSHLKAGHVAKLGLMTEVRDLLDDVRRGEAGALLQRTLGGPAHRWLQRSAGYNREQELLADNMAAALIGGDVMAATQAEAALRGIQYARFLEEEVAPALADTPFLPARLGAGFASYVAARIEDEAAILAALRSEVASADAAYPTLAERSAAVAGIVAQTPLPPPRGEPVTWVRDLDKIDGALTASALDAIGVAGRSAAPWADIHRARVDADIERADALRVQVLERLGAASDAPGPAAADALVRHLDRHDAVTTLIALHDVDAAAAKAMQADDPEHVQREAQEMLADVFSALFLAEAAAAQAPLQRDFAGLWVHRRPLQPLAQEASRSLSPGEICARFRATL